MKDFIPRCRRTERPLDQKTRWKSESFRMGVSFAASKAREKASTVVRAANADTQLGSYCSRADRPDDPDRVVIHYLAGL